MVNPWFPAGFLLNRHSAPRGKLPQIEALRKKLRILVDHNSNAPELEKLAAEFSHGHAATPKPQKAAWSRILPEQPVVASSMISSVCR